MRHLPHRGERKHTRSLRFRLSTRVERREIVESSSSQDTRAFLLPWSSSPTQALPADQVLRSQCNKLVTPHARASSVSTINTTGFPDDLRSHAGRRSFCQVVANLLGVLSVCVTHTLSLAHLMEVGPPTHDDYLGIARIAQVRCQLPLS